MRRKPTAAQAPSETVQSKPPMAAPIRTYANRPKAPAAAKASQSTAVTPSTRTYTAQPKGPVAANVQQRTAVAPSTLSNAPTHTNGTHKASHPKKPHAALPTAASSSRKLSGAAQSADRNLEVSSHAAASNLASNPLRSASRSLASSPSPPPPHEVLKRHLDERKSRAQQGSSQVPKTLPVRSNAPATQQEEPSGIRRKSDEPQTGQSQSVGLRHGQSGHASSNATKEKSCPPGTSKAGPSELVDATRPLTSTPRTSSARPKAPAGEALQASTLGRKSVEQPARPRKAPTLQMTRVPPPQSSDRPVSNLFG